MNKNITVEELIQQLSDEPENVAFQRVIDTIENNYQFTPTSFTCGDLRSEAGQNSGSCKILAFAKRHNINKEHTLHCFGHYYRDDVLQHPDGDDHQNIRNFIEHGWEGVSFSADPLQAK